MPLPESLGEHVGAELTGDSPLDEIEPASHGNAVVAFERARRHGRGAAKVQLVGQDDQSWLEVFDLQATDGCFVAVAIPMGADEDEGVGSAELAPRQSSYELTVTGVIQALGPDFTRMFGWTEDDVVGKSSLDFIHPDDHEIGIIGWIELLEKPGGQYRLRQRLKTAGGEWLWCELTETNLLDDPASGFVTSEIVDVSREMAAQAALQRRERLLDRLSKALPTGVLQLDADGAVEVRNDRWTALVGSASSPSAPASEDGGSEPSGSMQDGLDGLLQHLVDPEPVERAVAAAMADGLDADLAVTFDGTGTCRFGELHLRPLVEDEIVAGLLITLDDVTKLQMHRIELAEQARRDRLTGAYNRLGIDQLMADRLSTSLPKRRDLTLLFLDLDRFKSINDTNGHAVGDEVLRLFVEYVGGLLRPTDLLGRVGGDEFVIILGAGTPAEQASIMAGRISKAMPALTKTLTGVPEIGVSIGIAEARIGDDFDSLMKRADAAMYSVKNRRRATDYPAGGPALASSIEPLENEKPPPA